MNLEELKNSGRIIFECVSGSWLYNTNIATSDRDMRGIYLNPKEEYLGLTEPSRQINDSKHDVVYYSLKRTFELLIGSNPNFIELLWVPDDFTTIKTPIITKLIENRDIFISKKCFGSHIGYAQSQFDDAISKNRKVHNPQPKEMPTKEDFCWFIEGETMKGYREEIFPCRPKLIKDCSFGFSKPGEPIDLSKCHASSTEHASNVYRIYYYGSDAKGVFRGDDMLVCESIPKQDETHKFEGILIYNQNEYEKAVKEWHSYWDWYNNRNVSRWIDQEKGKLNYNSKNLMHCMRLLWSGENILSKGFPIVRFEGKQRDYLMKIRNSELSYEEMMKEVKDNIAKLESLYETSTIPYSVDEKKIEELYRELTEGV